MSRLKPDKADARFLRRVIALAVIVAVGVAFYRALELLILAFGSVLGAIVIRAVSDFYQQRLRLSERLAVGGAMVTVLLGIAFLIWLFAVQFGQQINNFVSDLPMIVEELRAAMSTSPVGREIYKAVEAAYAGSRIAQDLSGIAQGSIVIILNTILLLIGALFLAANPGVYRRGLLLLVPPGNRAPFADALDDTGATLSLWLRAQVIQMTTMGVLVGFGLWIAGVPSSAALGLLAGLSEFVPYVGPTAAMIPALALAATQGVGTLIAALIAFAVVRLIQTNFITPFVQQRVIDIPPAITLFAIIGIGYVFGMVGLFFSAALLVVIFTLVRALYLREVLGEDISPPGSGSLPSETP
ncbi:AI-2E family transporter [Stakelama tenebrarum]|uniref:AI-2E family transporter n=1 Tax=Stakelama tenebrarum TaxID=2711215 RepID=A0A6G6Y9P1_9SPHN|nr:AI-2E family transporter [Sphingosinithalassobacter tenebrarum]QIG81293.1 AI-2E family transporter [Sphingosinithalassobacter tenebrarum]